MIKRLKQILLISLFPAFLVGQATIDENVVEKTVVVDTSGAGDYRTIRGAFIFLNKNPELSVKVVIKPGIYREEVTRVNSRTAAATIIEGTSPDEVIITGADIWTNWKEEGKGLYSAPWQFDWGLAGARNIAHSSDFYDVQVKTDLGKRAEMVWWNDGLLKQVDRLEDLVDASFFVDEDNDKLWLKTPANESIQDAQVEVSVRQQLAWFRQVSNLVLRNITFKRAANSSQLGDGQFAVAIFGNGVSGDFRIPGENISHHLKIENCRFNENNGKGITSANYNYVSVIDSDFSDNGIGGAGMSRYRYVEMKGCTFKRNNWRIGGYGKYYDWVPAGIKFLQCADMVIEDSLFEGNLCTGLWLDWHLEDVLMRNIIARNNGGPGLYIEASVGPFLVTDSEFTGNGMMQGNGVNHGGILIAESRHVTINNCLLKENSHGQILIRSMERKGCGGFFSGERFDGSVRDISIVNNTMIGKSITPSEDVIAGWFDPEKQSSGGLIMMSTHGTTSYYEDEFLSTLWAAGNTYYHPDTEAVFSTGGEFGWFRVTLDQWQKHFGLDYGSTWESPKN